MRKSFPADSQWSVIQIAMVVYIIEKGTVHFVIAGFLPVVT
jgi:hypothetical protein